MRIAVLSDIHGNLPALDAVLAVLRPFDAIWQLGDVVGYGPQPDEVVDRLRAGKATGVRGNHDAAAIGDLDTDAFNRDARTAVEWTAGRISEATRAWLRALPETTTAGDFTLAHGSPRDPTWEYLLTPAAARANMKTMATTHGFVGHTHVPLVFREDGGTVETLAPEDGSIIEIDDRRALLNPGSVGQPRDGDPRASAALFDTEAKTVAWRRVEYDIAATQERMRAAGLPRRLIERLERGL
ncbi:MAG: metallophosphoesterase family protein [Candidatus Limnocylindrales bacterium]